MSFLISVSRWFSLTTCLCMCCIVILSIDSAASLYGGLSCSLAFSPRISMILVRYVKWPHHLCQGHSHCVDWSARIRRVKTPIISTKYGINSSTQVVGVFNYIPNIRIPIEHRDDHPQHRELIDPGICASHLCLGSTVLPCMSWKASQEYLWNFAIHIIHIYMCNICGYF